ncbi:MAG: PatB family C-S lyase [Anaerolineales bacterium]|nr:PatB family C-S lyase [Anaerolineales bacterium]
MFDQIINRRNTDNTKWDLYGPDVLPMWVADMDFLAPPAVREALRAKVEHGIFGYQFPPSDWFGFVCERLERLYGWRTTPDMVVAVPGIIAGFNVAARAFCEPGSSLLIQPPAYPPFLQVHENAGLQRRFAPLVETAQDSTLRYAIDFDAFEAAITPDTRMFLFCHPHNPTGRTFTSDELRRLADICLRHNIIICSDEIHSELLLGGATHTPIATLSPEIEQRTVTLISASKTFNLAALFTGFAVIPNAELRRQYRQTVERLAMHPNGFGLTAAKVAYTQCDDWLRELRAYLTANRDTLVSYVREHLPGIRTTVPDATYLAWLDCRALNLQPNPFRFFLEHAKVALNDGVPFGPGGEGFVRLNFGCPRATLLEGLERMRSALDDRK